MNDAGASKDVANLEVERLRRKYERERRARLDAEAIAERFTRDALHDPLTGLANRALYMDRVRHALATSERHGTAIAAVLLDLNGFKEINDSYGHATGDELLCAVSRRLREAVRAVDTVARLGGDEFALMIEDVNDTSKVAIVERVSEALAAPFLLHGHPRQVSGSIGIAISRGAHDNPSELLQRADMAMYAAKREGKTGYAVFETGMHAAMVFRLEMKSDLQRALAENEFALHYQPVVDLPEGRLRGMEALIRWERPGGGMVPPSQFIPLAEETGLIVPIGWWVLRESCRQFREWQRANPQHPDLTLHVNVATKQLYDPRAAERVQEALSDSGLPSENLVLELTESGVMQDVGSSMTAMERLTALGLRMGVDDFGTGYSSLSYLQKLPVTVLKIDKSFVDDVAVRSEAAALVSAIVSVGAALKLQVVAEGVEYEDQAARLHALGCHYAQGYFFSRPLDPFGMEDFLRRP